VTHRGDASGLQGQFGDIDQGTVSQQHPFGVPVVPDVYCSITGCSESVAHGRLQRIDIVASPPGMR